MKKFISIFVLAFICLFGLVACGGEQGEKEKEPEGEQLSETLSNAKSGYSFFPFDAVICGS